MLDSLNNTSTTTDVVFLIDKDDDLKLQYFEFIPESKIMLFDNTKSALFIERTLTEKINSAFSLLADDYEYFSVSNDDFVYHTPAWDQKLINVLEDYGPGIAYGNDLLQGKRLPTTSIVSGKIVKALGWLQMPSLSHLYGDEVWKFIGNELNILFYVDNVIIEHKHWIKDRSLIDETYKNTNSQQRYDQDGKAFSDWKEGQAREDIEKLRRSLDL